MYEAIAALQAQNGATLTQQALEHIVLRHWPTSGAQNAGKYSSDVTARNLRDMIDEAVQHGRARPNTNNRPGVIFEYTFRTQIGVNVKGAASSRLRVVVNEIGEVITAFPI